MAIQNITYDDKVSIQTSSLPNANKCRAEDLNEIKSVVNNNASELASKGIVESGSNANGNYIKYGDGTMLCWKRKEVTVAINHAWGSLYENQTPEALGNYAQEFISKPMIQASIAPDVGYPGALIARVEQGTESSFGNVVLLRPVSTSSQTYQVDLLAIGQWK